MTSFGSAIKNAKARSGFAVLTFLLATLLGAVAPPSLQSQISSLTTSLASPQCEGTTFNIDATVTNRQTSKPGDGGVQGAFGNPAWPGGMLAQNAGANNNAVNNLALGDDELSGEQNPVEFGGGDFEFEFYGELLNLSNDGFYVSSNGFITFIDNNAATGIVPANVPAAAAPNHTILIANVDIDPNAGGDIWWQVQNGPNGDVLVITFENVPYVNPFQANLANFQLIIYDNDHLATPNRIEWRIDDLPQPGGVYGVIAGYENECGTDGDAVYQNAAAAFGAIDNEAYTADPTDGPGLAAIQIQYFEGGTNLMGTQTNNTPAGASTNFSFAVPPAYRTVGNHTYSATVTYTYFNCLTETTSATATPDPFVVVANPTPPAPTVSSPVCGNSTATASVPANGTNSYTWVQTGGPGGAITSFTPNGTNAAASTTMAFNNALLAANGTNLTIQVTEALTVAPFCTGSNTQVFTAYATPGQPTISGSGTNNGGINPPALPGAPGNPCAGTSRTYLASASKTDGNTYYRWQLSGAPAGTTIGGVAVVAGSQTFTSVGATSVTIAWGNSTTDVTATLVVTASNGTGGSTGSPGTNKSCVGLASAATSVFINGQPVAQQVVQTVPAAPGATSVVCENETRTYGVTLTHPGSTFAWSVTDGGGVPVAPGTYTLVTGAPPNNNSATIDWNGAGTYRVNVTETTSGGCSVTHTFHTVTVNVQPQPVLSAPAPTQQCTYIGGPIENGQNLAEYNYTVTPHDANNRFDWAVTNGVFVSTALSTVTNINAVGANATQAVRWTSAGVQQVSVTETIVATGCSKTVTENVTVTASPTPKTISGPGYNTGLAGNPCANTLGHVYSVTGPIVGNTYNWNFPGATGGASFAGATSGTSVTIDWGAAGTYTLRLTETEPGAGCVTERTFDITVNPLPNGTIPANVQVCNGNNVVYTYTPGAGDLGGATYLWTVAPPSVIVGPNNGPSVTIQGNTPGPGVGNDAVTLTVTNPGVGACALNLNGNVQIVPTTNLAAATIPTPICVGGQYAFTGNSSGHPGGSVIRTWTFSITPTVAYTGSAPLSTTFISNTASANWTNVTVGDSSLADVLAGGDFDLSISYTDVLGTASCPVGPQVTNVTVEPRPTRPTVDFVSPVCNLNVPTDYTITNYDAALAYAVSGPAGFGAAVGVPNPNNIQVTAWGAPGVKTINVDATDATGCTRRSVYTITVVATPANPQPEPITIQAVCVDSGYFDNAAAINATVGAPVALSPAPTRVITYTAPAPIPGHWYQWYVTNGFIVEGGNSVGQFNTAQQNATSVDVVWTGPNPGKVKYLVFTSDPNAAPPAPCFAASIEPTVNLPIIPNVPLTFTTSSSEPGDKVCEGNPVTLTLSGSKVGLDYRVEEWDAGTWTDIGVTPVAGTGGAVNIVVPASVLDIVTSPTTDHTFRITAKDNAFAPGVAGPCEWLRTATDVITITVFDTPDQKTVVVNNGLSVGGGVFAVCEGDQVLIDVQNTQNFVQYSLERRQIFPATLAWAPVPASAQLGTGGTITLIDNTTAGIGTGGATLNVNNYEWRVSALIPPAPLNPPAGGCQVYMTQTGQVRVFELPADPTVTFSPNPVCWNDDITVNLANTEAGVEYEVLNNGSSLSPQVILQGTGGAVNGLVNSKWILPANPSGSQVVNNVYVEARLVQNGTYTRPIPASTCPQDYGSTNITVLEKPVASISGPDVVCGPSTADYVGAPVTPSPVSTYDWELMAPVYVGIPVPTTPLSATNTGNGTVNPFTVNWGVNNLSCDGTYNPASQQIRMIVTNNNGCKDTAFIDVTIEPTVYDAAVIGDNSACIYGGHEEHLETYSIQRPDPCVYPAGTTFFWEMPTGTVSGAIRSGQSTETIIAEWHTTGGSGIGTVKATVTLPASHGGCSTTRTLDVAVYPLPVPTINGPASVCQGQQNVAYTADSYPTDHYYWSVIGGTIDGGTGTGVVGDTARRDGVGINTISIDWNDEPNPNAFVRLKQVSAQGCMEVTDFAVVVNPTPTPVINGADVACDNSVYTYNTADNAPNNTYQWTITSGNATITGGANQAAATVLTGDIGGGNSFTIQLTETVLATNCTKTVSKNVTIVEKPNPTITRIAPPGGAVGGACLDQTITYGESDPVAGVPNYSYKWTVSNGTIVGSDEANTLQVTWNTVGAGTVTLTKWHTGSQCTTTVSQTVNIVDTPAPTISGPTTVCGESEHEYSTPFVAGNTYSWAISGNGAFTGGQLTNAAMVEFVNPTPGNQLSATLTVTETNTLSGCTSNAQLVVTINYQPQEVTITRVSPAGPANQACNNSTIVYSVPNNTGAAYNWTVTGGTIVSGGTSNEVTVQWTNVGTQTLTVVETNAQGDCSATSTLDVGVTYQPVPAISGNATVCTGDVVTYSTPDVPGSTYLWSLPSAGGNILTGVNTHQMTVEWILSGSRTVQVVETNGNCTATATLTVTIGKTPTTTDISRVSPVGNVSVACVNEVITYSTPNNGTSEYEWTVTGGNIVGSNTTNTVAVEWTTIGNQTLTVVETTAGTDCSKTDVQNISVEDQPNPSIAGPTVVCMEDVSTYAVNAVGGHSYNWSISGGGTIVTGTNASTIDVEWTSAGTHTITVTQSNATGNCTATATLDVEVRDKPNTTEITRNDGGNVDNACEGYTYEYGTNTANPANYEFEWAVTGGQFENGNTTPTVDVKWTQVGNNTLTVTVTTPGTDCEVTVTQNVSVTPTPQPNIDGPTISCINKDHVYQTPYVAGNTYEWEITDATPAVFAPITGYPTSNVIEVKWIQAGLHTMTLTETNVAGGCATTVSINVQVNEIPSPDIYTSGDETGFGNPKERRPGIVCNASTHDYATAYDPTPGSGNAGNSFIWTVTGGQIMSGQYTNEIQVTWGPAGIGTIAVEETVPGSDCITTVLDSIDIRPTPMPVVTGNEDPCDGSTAEYTTTLVAGNSYDWDVVGGTILSGQGTNTIRVRWNTTNWPNVINGEVKVTEWVTDVLPSKSCINDYTLDITVRPTPESPTINGVFDPCATDFNTTPETKNLITYSIVPPATDANVQGTLSYQWSVSPNGQIDGFSGGTSVDVYWFNNGTTPQQGSITVVLTSSFGCTSQSSAIVTIKPLPKPQISGPTSVCHNALQTYSTPGFPGHQYEWEVEGGNAIRSGQGTPNVTVEWTVTGTYTLKVTETNTYGCVVMNEVDVTVNELPNATITASGPTTFCQGGDVTLTAPLGYASYVWSTGETARSIVVRTSGEYWVKVTDENGCSNNSDTITVNVFPSTLPIITVSGPTTFCEGGSVTLTAPAGFDAYLWSTGETTQSITVTESGSYTVTVADDNGCTGTSTEVDVFVNPKPSPVLTVVGSTTVCSGDSVEVRAPLGYVSYTWVSTSGENYGTERSIFVTATDTIYCQVVDANGCVGESDTIVITVSPVIDPVIDPNGPTEFCEGGSVKLSAPEGFATYFWSNGATTREIVVEDGGDYFVTVTNGAACESVSAPTNVVVFTLPARPSISRTGDTLKAESAVAEAYQWYRNGVMIPGENEVNLVVNQPGTYRVEIADNNTCSSISDGFDVILTSVDDDVVAGRRDLSIFPNPTNGQFTIEGEISVAGNVSIELVNMVGEIVMTKNAFSNGGLFTQSIDMGTLASGVYNVIVTSENQRWTIRLVRQ